MHGVAIALIIIAKLKRLEHTVEVVNEEVKQAHALTNAAMKREWVAKWKAERVKAAHIISKEKVKKFKIALVVSWVMFVILLILSTKFEEVEIR